MGAMPPSKPNVADHVVFGLVLFALGVVFAGVVQSTEAPLLVCLYGAVMAALALALPLIVWRARRRADSPRPGR